MLASWVNGRVWDPVFHDLPGMAPEGRLTSSLHVFFHATVKISLLLSGIISVTTIPCTEEVGAILRKIWPYRRVLRPQLLGIDAAVGSSSIVAVGYLFNDLLD